MRISNAVLMMLCGTLAACAGQPGKQDPLQITRKLVSEGHATLYNNGAFEIPMTTIHIIPPAEDTLDFALELGGMRARQSFQESIKHARESVDLAKAGVGLSVQAAGAVRDATGDIAHGARSVAKVGGELTLGSPYLTWAFAKAAVTYAGAGYDATAAAGNTLAASSLAAGASLSQQASEATGPLWSGTRTLADATRKDSVAASASHFSYAAERFVQGYAAVPRKIGQHVDAAAQSASLSHFVDAFRRSNAWRETQSGKMTGIMVGTVDNYTKDIADSFRAAGKEMSQGELENGYTFALMKSLGWVVQGVFWDATIKPATKLAGASLGYVVVNGLAVPVLVTNEAGAVANVAVQVTWNAAASAYDVTAPTATAALAGLYGAVELAGGHTLAAGEYAVGGAATAGTYVGGKLAAGATAGSGYLAGKTVQYVGAPLSAAGIAVGGTAVGVVSTAGVATAGAGIAVAGAAGEVATRVAGNAAAATALVGGSVASVATGAALGTYELSKAVIVPAGHEVGAGVVLGYDTLSQLSAHTVLAVADASYMVLSLEGPKWVLYAVKGNVDNGEHLPSSAIVDLKGMRQAGETIIAVPASDEEMKRVVDAVPGQFPVKPQAQEPQGQTARNDAADHQAVSR